MGRNLSVKNAEAIKVKFQKKIDELLSKMQEVDDYVLLAESYEAVTLEQKIIKYYAIFGTLNDVADKLNTEGLKFNDRKWQSKDVSNFIQKQKPIDSLHEKLQKTFNDDFDTITKRSKRY